MRLRFTVSLVGALTCAAPEARAWLFEEHANVGRHAFAALSDEQKAQLEAWWSVAREGDPAATSRLCKTALVPVTHDRKDSCIDLAMLASIAGDHSCTPSEMWTTATVADFTPALVEMAGRTERELREHPASRVDTWHRSHLELLDVDVAYLTRASSNQAHFLRARALDDGGLDAYLRNSAKKDAPISATAAYLTYHGAAIGLAATLRHLSRSDAAYVSFVRAMLASELFALHFLEDSFSSGHITGGRPSRVGAERIGTHDYYCQNGLDAHLWSGGSLRAYGDAFLDDEGLRGTERAIRLSVAHLIDVASGDATADALASRATDLAMFDVCKSALLGAIQPLLLGEIELPRVRDVLLETPMPYRDVPSLPPFSTEEGAFVRINGGLRGGADLAGGYPGPAENVAIRPFGGFEFGAGVGAGLEGITTRSTDATFTLQGNVIGLTGEIDNEASCPSCPGNVRVPLRLGGGGRLRLPFAFVPGDMIPALAMLATPGSRKWLRRMGLLAASGGPFGLEKVHTLAPALSFQLIPGREVGVSYVVAHTEAGRYHTVSLDLPLVELRSEHFFYGAVGGDAVLQVGPVFDFNTVQLPSSDRRVSGVGVLVMARLSFSARLYFARL